MEQTAECIHSKCYGDDLSRSSLGLGCVEDVLGKGDRVMRRIFEDYETNSKETCCEKDRPLEHVVELERPTVSLN